MNILILRTSADVMDINTYNLQEVGLAKALIRKGHKCDVGYYCGDKEDHKESIDFDGDKKVTILWLSGKGIMHDAYFPNLKKYIDDYDIIQVGGYVGITPTFLNKKYGDKVVNFHGPYFCKYNVGDNLRAFLYDHALLPFSNKKNMIVATKSVLATEYVKKKGIRDVTTIGVGLDLDSLMKKSDNENPFVTQLKDNKNDDKYLLYIGKIEPRRNTLFLIELFKKISEQQDNYKLVIIGKGEAEYKKKCFDIIKDYNLENKVIYQEKVEQKNMKDIYNICDAFLLPTRYEIFGMVLLEVMYFGLPVFTTYNGGSATLIDNHKNGFIINNYDIDEWSKSIVDVLENSELYENISKNATATIKEQYTWDKLSNKFIDLYNRRLNR